MIKKQVYRILSLILLFSGTFFMLNSRIRTIGAVIGISALQSRISFTLGLSFMFVAVILFVMAQKRYHILPLEDLIRELGKDSVIIIDTSAIIEYKKDIMDLLGEYDKNQIYIPQKVLWELGGKKEKALESKTDFISQLKSKSNSIQVPQKYTDIAKKYLELTAKSQVYYKTIDYVNNVLEYLETGKDTVNLRKKDGTKYTRREVEEVEEDIRKVKEIAQKEAGYVFRYLDKKQEHEKIKDVLESEFKPSETDAEVLGYALYQAKHKKVIEIFARDRDFEDAIGIIKKGYKGKDFTTGKDMILKPHKKIRSYIEYQEPGRLE